MSTAGDLGDVQRQPAHPFGVGDVLHRAHHDAQVPGDGRLQRQQDQRGVFGVVCMRIRWSWSVMTCSASDQVGLQQRLGRPLHRDPGQAAHLAQRLGQRVELVVERRSAWTNHRSPSLHRSAVVERVMNGPFPLGETGTCRPSLVGTGLCVRRVRAEGDRGVVRGVDADLGLPSGGLFEGVPAGDYIPLVALLRRRLSDDEVVAFATELMSADDATGWGTDTRVAITKLTDEMPSQDDTERVKRRLVAAGWPVSESWGLSD